MLRQTLQLRQKDLGPEHPDTLGNTNNLGLVLFEQGKYVEAERMHWQTLQFVQQVLGPEHPDALMSMG
jgi:hypothetical protein